jgi:hypothetical protein
MLNSVVLLNSDGDSSLNSASNLGETLCELWSQLFNNLLLVILFIRNDDILDNSFFGYGVDMQDALISL